MGFTFKVLRFMGCADITNCAQTAALHLLPHQWCVGKGVPSYQCPPMSTLEENVQTLSCFRDLCICVILKYSRMKPSQIHNCICLSCRSKKRITAIPTLARTEEVVKMARMATLANVRRDLREQIVKEASTIAPLRLTSRKGVRKLSLSRFCFIAALLRC